MTKNYNIIFLLTALMLVACHHDDVVPDSPQQRAIVFGSSLEAGADAGTRAAELLPLYDYVGDFTVYGINGNLSGDGTFTRKDVVFDNYVVWHDKNSAETTESNTNGWEYVGSHETCDGKTTSAQRIKYWDYSQNCHYFWALANADRGEFGPTNLATDGRVANYTLTLTKENLSETMALYYSEIARVDLLDYAQVVSLRFKPFLSKVRFGFYETIPGYVVNNLKVKGADGTLADDIIISSDFVEEGTCEVAFDYNPAEKVTASITPSTAQKSTALNVGVVQYQTLSPRTDGQDEEDDLPNSFVDGKTYIARSSVAPSYTWGAGPDKDYFSYVLPYESYDKPLTLTCNFDLTNTENGVVRTVEDVSVTIPAEYRQWKPGHEYTYILKITPDGILFLFDVLVEPWHYGGSQTDEWRNW